MKLTDWAMAIAILVTLNFIYGYVEGRIEINQGPHITQGAK